MESKDAGLDGASNGAGEANEFSGSGSTEQQSNNFDFSGSPGSTEQGQSIRDRARSAVGSAGGKLSDVGSSVRDKAGSARDKLVGALEAGAGRLRERSQNAAPLAAATADGITAIESDGKVAQVSDRVAGGLQASADWLRDADIDGLKLGVERQVKDHPGRTLLIAAGLGYLIGRAFRNKE